MFKYKYNLKLNDEKSNNSNYSSELEENETNINISFLEKIIFVWVMSFIAEEIRQVFDIFNFKSNNQDLSLFNFNI